MTDVGETQTETDAAQPKPSVAQAVLERQIEAILMTVERPIPAGRIAEALDLEGTRPVTAAIEALNRFYQEHDLSFRIEQVAGGYQVFTLPKYHDVLTALHRGRTETRLSPAALETLAIIAYRQPALRAEIEAIRGVACGEVIRTLMDRHLVKIVGRAEEIGRPMLYGTTRTFLEMFGLASLKDLPKAEELNKP